MTQEEEFNLFRDWLIPKLEFKKGASYTYSLYPQDQNWKAVKCDLSIRISHKELDEYFEIFENKLYNETNTNTAV